MCLPVQDGYGFLSLWQKTYIRSSVVRVSWPTNALDAVEHCVYHIWGDENCPPSTLHEMEQRSKNFRRNVLLSVIKKPIR